jgi:hypothetical protein
MAWPSISIRHISMLRHTLPIAHVMRVVLRYATHRIPDCAM